MSDVSFTEEPVASTLPPTNRSVFMKLAYATGIPKNDVQAQQVLLGIAGLFIVVAIAYAVLSAPKSNEAPPPPPPPPNYQL